MIEKYTLDNGVRVIVEKIPTVRSVALGIWVGTGSRHEEAGNNGISHFTEHMLFKGTKSRSAKEIAESFDHIGGHVNAFTSKEYTCYYARILDEHAPLALDILADMFFHSTFDEEEITKERKVVIEEIKMYDDTPDDLVHDLIAKASFQNNPLGYSILGTEDVLNTFTRDTLIDYVEQRYTPSNLVITAAGNVSDQLLDSIQSYFSTFSRELKPSSGALDARDFDSTVRIRQKETEQAHLCLAFPGLEIGNEDIYSLILTNNILGGSMSSRLFQEVREQRGLAYSVFSYHSSFKDNGMFTVYAGTAPHQLEEMYKVITSTLQQLKRDGMSADELKKGKEQLKGSLMLSLESTNSRMSRLGKNELLLGKHLTLDEILERVDQVSLEHVRSTIFKVLDNKMSIALVSPFEQLPATFNQKDLLS
ncbi:zinc protease [Ammoniphilus oxalaticus]|uniref:Zinc protease n=1 Tax=Ammoniphilus oxalaticus TaxID=66863 RepID=A0A419SK00_9BACL|nr:pitrilysin family protein [Ammoniphilus oxalaticus]RKD24280.1 zinc protease [Ammoniphilus oxalaticus]